MSRSPRQKAILANMDRMAPYQPFIGHSSMVLVRSLMSYSPADFEELTEKQVRDSLYNLKKKKYIKTEKISDGNYKFELTKKGKKLLGEYEIEDMELKNEGKWDGKWRFIMFDIPERRRLYRDVLRDKLKKLNFFQVQQSVWVYPYECEEEIDLLLEFFGIEKYVLRFTTKVKRDELLIEYFEKEGFTLK